jgi:hypothetical protein
VRATTAAIGAAGLAAGTYALGRRHGRLGEVAREETHQQGRRSRRPWR